MKKLVLIDGNALLHRAYHATPPFTTSKGELINAVFGFTSMLLKVIAETKPQYLAIAWDVKGPTFRHQAYTQYKATRPALDEGLATQYKRVHQIIDAFNIPEFSLSGYEADDLIGTLATQAEKEKDLETIVATGDRDIMQLINQKLKVLMPKKTMSDVGLYGLEEFALKYGFLPKQLIDYKALAGDPSDNIPGVNGIGEVTATKLIHQFENVENIYKKENLAKLPPRTQTLLAEGAELAVISKKLATLDLKAPIKLDLKKCLLHDFDREKVIKLLEELEFKSLISRVPGNESQESRVKSQEKKEPRLSTLATSDSSKTSDLDLAVTPVLQKMTRTGILVDLKFLNRLGVDLKDRLITIEKEIYSKVGHEFNLNSPKQLSVVLFDELNLPVIRKTKTGRSTDEDTLIELKSAHPAIPFLLEYRQLFKLVSTYVDALPRYIGEDKRIHSTFNVEGAATGRLSSQDPNLQNIPAKGQTGGEIRRAFIAPKGKILLKADYSQIELRILAHLSDDPDLKKAFEEGVDIHKVTAAKIFKIPVDQVDAKQRNVGKTMNFATLYGQGPRALSQQLGIDFQTARLYIEEYFAQFPKIKQWMAKILEQGYKDGYVETIWGRRRYIPELQTQNRMFKAAGERAAVNHPIQGTQADMIKKAMVEIDRELTGNRQQSTEDYRLSPDACILILQVHDELLFECNGNSVLEDAKMIKDKMENALPLSIPVVVDLKVGPNWADMKPVEV